MFGAIFAILQAFGPFLIARESRLGSRVAVVAVDKELFIKIEAFLPLFFLYSTQGIFEDTYQNQLLNCYILI